MDLGAALDIFEVRPVCACGRRLIELPLAACCRLWYLDRYRSARRYGGNRDRVLDRDGRRCRICGTTSDLIVHHRCRGVDEVTLLISTCRGCHTRLHRSVRLRVWVPEVMLVLWREAHAGAPCQLQFDLEAA